MMPVSTSPVPAVASAAVSGRVHVRIAGRRRDHGARALQQHDRFGSRREVARRRDAIVADRHARRAARTRRRAASGPRAARPAAWRTRSGRRSTASAFSASASTTIGTGASATSRRDGRLRAVVAAEPGSDREGAEAGDVLQHDARRVLVDCTVGGRRRARASRSRSPTPRPRRRARAARTPPFRRRARAAARAAISGAPVIPVEPPNDEQPGRPLVRGRVAPRQPQVRRARAPRAGRVDHRLDRMPMSTT